MNGTGPHHDANHGHNQNRHSASGHHDGVPHHHELVVIPENSVQADSLASRVKERNGENSWQHKLVKFMLTEGFQTFLVCLLLIDVLCVVTELFLEARFPSCFRALETVEECRFNPDGTAAMETHHRAGDAHHGDDVVSYAPACKHHQAWLDDTHDVLRWLSISILIVFVVELLAMFAALRGLFFTSIVYVVDLLVVVTSLVLDFVLLARSSQLHSEEAAQFATLLVCARLWRFIRVGHGIFTATYETVEMQGEEEKRELHEEIHRLKHHIAQLEAAQHPFLPPPPAHFPSQELQQQQQHQPAAQQPAYMGMMQAASPWSHPSLHPQLAHTSQQPYWGVAPPPKLVSGEA